MNKLISIAGIGSRQTPSEIMLEMKKIGQWCRREHIEVRSGHASGADWAFEEGAQKFCTAIIPWKGFNIQLRSAANIVVHEPSDESIRSVHLYHPYPNNLSSAVQKIMARNFAQVMGIDGKSPAIAVVCYTKDGKDSGGTGQAIRIAEAKGIPVLNMRDVRLDNEEKVIRRLIKIINQLP